MIIKRSTLSRETGRSSRPLYIFCHWDTDASLSLTPPRTLCAHDYDSYRVHLHGNSMVITSLSALREPTHPSFCEETRRMRPSFLPSVVPNPCDSSAQPVRGLRLVPRRNKRPEQGRTRTQGTPLPPYSASSMQMDRSLSTQLCVPIARRERRSPTPKQKRLTSCPGVFGMEKKKAVL